MSIKSIVCLYDGERHEVAALDTCFSLTKASRGSLQVLHVCEPLPPFPSMIGASEYAAVAFGNAATLEALGAAESELSDRARVRAEEAGLRNGLPVWDPAECTSALRPHAYFTVACGEVPEVVATQGRNADLIVMGYETMDRRTRRTAVAALFEAGRPLMLIRQDAFGRAALTNYPSIICVAWDGSLSACRAVHEAVPFMLRADEVYIVRLRAGNEPIDRRGDDDIRAYLDSHSITARFIHAAVGEESIGASLLVRAAAVHAQLLIMGAFGHGQLTESLFGGVTEHIMRSARLPVMLVH